MKTPWTTLTDFATRFAIVPEPGNRSSAVDDATCFGGVRRSERRRPIRSTRGIAPALVCFVALAAGTGTVNAGGAEGIGGLDDLIAIAGLLACLAAGALTSLLVHALRTSPARGPAWRAIVAGMLWGLVPFAVVYGITIGLREQESRMLNERAADGHRRIERSIAEFAAMRPGTVGPALLRAIAIAGDDDTPGAMVLKRRDGERMAFEFGVFIDLLPGLANALRSFEAPPTAEDIAALEAFIAANDAALAASFETPAARRQIVTGYYTDSAGGRIAEDLHGTLFWVAALGSSDQAGARARCATLPEYAIQQCETSFDRSSASLRH